MESKILLPIVSVISIVTTFAFLYSLNKNKLVQNKPKQNNDIEVLAWSKKLGPIPKGINQSKFNALGDILARQCEQDLKDGTSYKTTSSITIDGKKTIITSIIPNNLVDM
jgi:hypothetical protein